MDRILLTLSLALIVPAAGASGLLPVNPIVGGDFELDTSSDGLGPAGDALDVCIGVGHQAYEPLYSTWSDWLFATADSLATDPTSVDPTTPEFAEAATAWPVAHAEGYAADPAKAVLCAPGYNDAAMLNPRDKLADPSLLWSSDPATEFGDFDGDGDREVRVPRVPAEHNHNLWQSIATSTQAWSADFDAFAFTLESGAIPAGANVQVGLSLTPGYMQSPWVGAFWEGAVMFRANDMVPDADGRIAMDPVAKGEIICPGGYTPCLDFRAAYLAADADGKRTLLGQTRIVQTSFWAFGSVSPVVIDDVAYVGAKTAVETVPNVNPGA